MSSNFQLVIRKGGNPGQIFSLDLTEMFIGRDASCEIMINDSEVSRRHARIFISGQGFVIEDLGSTNGTFLNGQRITGSQALFPGAIIGLGDSTTLQFEVSDFDPDATRAAATPPEFNQTFVNVPPQSFSGAPMVSVLPQSPVQNIPPVSPMHSVPPMQPVPPPPIYSGQVPSSPNRNAPAPKKRSKLWLIILLVILFFVCICVGFVIVVDQMNLYCDLAPGIMNSIFGAGSCP